MAQMLHSGISIEAGNLPCAVCDSNKPACNLAAGSQILDSVGVEGTGTSASATVASSIPKGAGPRIYVGGIPNAVSETMVRNYFSNWGKVCCCVAVMATWKLLMLAMLWQNRGVQAALMQPRCPDREVVPSQVVRIQSEAL